MIKTNSWPLLALSLLLYTTSGFSTPEVPQKGIIKGKIIDALSGEPVAYTNVLLYNKADSVFLRGTTSDSTGTYTLEKINTGQYYLVFTFIGYKNIIPDASHTG